MSFTDWPWRHWRTRRADKPALRLDDVTLSWTQLGKRIDRLAAGFQSQGVADGDGVMLLAHNHPSGVALPSPADNATTLSVFDALRTVGVELADHIIVADDDFVSLRHNGLLPERKGNGYGI